MDKSYSNGVVFDNFFIKEEEFILEDNLVVDKDTHYTIIDMHIYKTIIKDKIEILIQSKIENDNNVMQLMKQHTKRTKFELENLVFIKELG